MPKNQRKEYRKKRKSDTRKENNKGAGLISVIIAVAFVTILGSIIISATLSNYRMKQTIMDIHFYYKNGQIDK